MWLLALIVIIIGAVIPVWWVIGLGYLLMLVGGIVYGVHDSRRERTPEPQIERRTVRFEVADD